MAEVLELTQLPQHDRETEVDVGGRGVDAQLDAQRCAPLELASQLAFTDDVDRTRGQDA